MRKHGSQRTLLALVVLAVGAWTGRADASAFQLVEQNASGLGNAYSGQAAAAEDASTLFFNPAGMTLLPGGQVVAVGNLIRPRSRFNDTGSTPATLQPTLGGNGGDAGSLAFIPNAYVSWEVLRDIAWAGIGVNVPFGLSTEWDPTWAGRFHAIDSDVQTINVNPSVAWKINDWVSIGAGANWQWIGAELSNAVNYSAIAAGVAGPQVLPVLGATCPGASPTGAGCEGVGTVEGDARSWGWNVGAMLSLPTKTRVGVSYRSSIEHELEGNVTFTNRPALLANGLPDGDIETTIELPDTLSFAVAQQVVPRLQLLADFTWTGWSKLKDLSIFRASGAPFTSTPLEFDDSWRVGLGANLEVVPSIKARAGVAHDRTPVQDEFRTPRLPDNDRTWVAGGAQWAFSSKGAVDVGLAYLFIGDSTSNLPSVDPEPPAGFTATPKGSLVGEYSGPIATTWIASAQVRYSF